MTATACCHTLKQMYKEKLRKNTENFITFINFPPAVSLSFFTRYFKVCVLEKILEDLPYMVKSKQINLHANLYK